MPEDNKQVEQKPAVQGVPQSFTRPLLGNPLVSSYVQPSPLVGGSYVQPQVQYVSQAPVQYVSQAPVQYVSQAGALRQSYKGESRIEQVPYERTYTDYEAVTRVEYVPVQKTYTDYYEIEHQTEYVPQPRYETRVEYVPTQRVEEVFDYVPVQSRVVRAESTVAQPQVNLPPVQQSVVYNQAPLQNLVYSQAPLQYTSGYPYQPLYASRLVGGAPQQQQAERKESQQQ